MANKFTQSAKKSLGGCPVMNGRTKISTDEIIAKYPDGITIVEFDLIIKNNSESYPVLAFAEDNTRYFNGGKIAAAVVEGWVEEYAGDIAGANADLKQCGGAKFKLYKKTTKTGRTATAFEPVD